MSVAAAFSWDRVLVLVAAATVSGCADSPATRALRIASASTSMTLCNAAFVSGLDPDQAYQDEVRQAPGMRWVSWTLRYEIDRVRREVNTTIASTVSRRAVYRDGFGCVLALGAAAPFTWKRPPSDVSPPDPYSSLSQAGTVQPTDRNLRQAIDEAFAETRGSSRRNTQAVVVVHHGQLIAERYAPGISPTTPLPGHSLSKSVIHALVGILTLQGKVQPDLPVPLKEWQSAADGRQAITPNQLLSMAGGLPWDEYHGGFDPATRLWFDEPDPYQFAQGVRLDNKPGTYWAYSNLGYTVLSRLVREQTGGTPMDVLAFAQGELFAPLDMRHMVISFDLTGTPMGANGFLASARDWARLGLLYLDDGRVAGRQLLPSGWVASARSPTLGAGYGRGFWLNNTHAPHPLPGHWGMPEAPPDTFFGRGYLGQFIVIVPSQDLIVVRLGISYRTGGDIATVGHMVAKVIEALESAPR
jgi:CubicO group peptidase (beta-lactamase class C family)